MRMLAKKRYIYKGKLNINLRNDKLRYDLINIEKQKHVLVFSFNWLHLSGMSFQHAIDSIHNDMSVKCVPFFIFFYK